MANTNIAIYGAGGFGREIAWLVEAYRERNLGYKTLCFVDDTPGIAGSVINNIPVATFEAVKQFKDVYFAIAQGNPKNRELLSNKVKEAGFFLATLIHPRTEMSNTVGYGEGTVICAGNSLTVNITMGTSTQINLHCTIGHDVILGDYCTLSPGAHISGWVHIGNRVFIGTGAVIINGTKEEPLIIEDDVTIGAGSCVTKSLKAGKTYVGTPARSVG